VYVRLGHLGTAQDTAVAATTVSTAGSVVGVLAAIPIVGAIAGGVAALLSLFHVGQGCGQKCITSADTEQIFEAAADNVKSAGDQGMITQSQAAAAIQWLQAQGDSTMQNLQKTDSSASGGKTNMDKTLQAEIAAVQSDSGIPSASPTVSLDPGKLESSVFIQPSAKGWYGDAVSQGASLALQAIAEVTGVSSGGSSNLVDSSASSASAPTLISGVSNSTLLIAVAVVVGAGFLFTRGQRTTPNPRRRLRRKYAR